MSHMERADVVVVGGGIIGLATAQAISRSQPARTVIILEKEEEAGLHQSGHNSGVIHSGVYYRPGSLKARTVAAGRASLIEFCRDNGIVHDIIGKVIVAIDESELPGLHELERRARGNSVAAALVGPERLAELEPHAAGIKALHVQEAGIVDFRDVCETLRRILESAQIEFRPRCRVLRLSEAHGSVIVATELGDVEAKVAVNCAGLHSDRLARRSGQPEMLRIVPFRGEYRRLVDDRSHLVQTMIYPVPDPRFPFLGVHLTRGVGGTVSAGPNAVLALSREGYSWRAIDLSDTWALMRFPGFRRLAARHWRTGLAEVRRSLSSAAFVRALQRLVPDVRAEDVVHAPAGVRAQAVDAGGGLVDDFVVQESRRVVHVLNAPSPAATASLEVGRMVAERALEQL